MKFKKIVLNNFRQYKGRVEVEFSTDENKNITVVYGGITCGKTTLLQAFNWVLYGVANLQNKEKLLNFEVEDSMKELGEKAEVFVELYIDNDGVNYKFKRINTFMLTENGNVSSRGGFTTVEKQENDVWKNIGNYDEEVKNIIPYDLSTYFFFDGERMNAISEEQRKGSDEVAQSVKTILGLEHYNTAIKHLSKGKNCVISELRSRLNTEANEKLEELKDNIDSYDNDIQIKTEKIDDYNDEIENLENQKHAKEKIIRDNKETYMKQTAKEQKKAELSRAEEREEKLYDNYYKYFNNYYLDFFYYGLHKKTDKLKDILSIQEEGIPNMHSKAIKYILKRGYCLCGEKISIDEHDEHYKAIIEEMKKLPPESLGTSIFNFKKELGSNIKESKNNYFIEEITNKYADISENMNEQFRLNEEIESISIDIESNVDVGRLETEVKEIDIRIKDFLSKIARLEVEIENLKKYKDRDNKEIMRLSQYDTRNIVINKQMQMAERIVEILSKKYESKEEVLINALQQEINKYLQKIYEGKRYMRITKDYKFQLLYENDNSEDDSIESEGLGTVKAISFMCGLLDVAKSKFLPEVSDGSMYPLVFDAPLSKIDSVHRKNVMSSLPEIASQVIIFTREEKDLEDITNETKLKIGTEYQINKISEKCSEISVKEGV